MRQEPTMRDPACHSFCISPPQAEAQKRQHDQYTNPKYKSPMGKDTIFAMFITLSKEQRHQLMQ